MPDRHYLLGLLGGLCLLGGYSLLVARASSTAGPARSVWIVFLILLPLALAGCVWMAWRWSAMACVIYGTIGLALDLATLLSIAPHLEGELSTAALSGLSGLANFFLILFGGRSFLQLPSKISPPGSHPPNPPTPF